MITSRSVKANAFFGLTAVLLLFFIVSSADADLVYTYGFSPRGIGMGNAMTAIADDWSAPYYNPAGTAFQRQPAFGFGYFFADSAIQGIGVDDPPLDQTKGLIFGVTLPIPFDAGFFHDRLTFGVAGFMPQGMLIRMGVAAPTEPNLILLQNASRSTVIIPTLGFRITNGLAFGGGMQTFIDTLGELNAYIDPSGAVQTETGEELVVTYKPIVSVLFKPGEHWDAMRGWGFGFVFREECLTKYRIPISAALGDIPFIIAFDAISLFIPRQYVLGVSYARGEWKWEIDGAFQEWSRFPDPHLLIETDVSIPIVPVSFQDSTAHPPHFHDTFAARAGTEVRAYSGENVDLFLRAGYGIDPSPMPPQTGYTNQLDTDRHIGAISTGVKWYGVGDFRFGSPLVFDVFGQMQYLSRRVMYKNDNVETDNPGYPKLGMEGWLYSVGASLSANFDYE